MMSLAQFLNEQHADRETVLQATRYWVSEKWDDTPDNEQQKILTEVLNPKEFERIKELLSNKPDILEAVCLMVLSQAWEDPDDIARIQNAIAAAKEKLPMIDKVILAVIVMYAIHQLATQGGSNIRQTTVQNQNGTYSQKQEITHEPFSPEIEPILKLFDPKSAAPAKFGSKSPTSAQPKSPKKKPKLSKHPASKTTHSKKDECE